MSIGLILTTAWYVPFCLEYLWTYLIMFIVTIIAILIENKKKEYINILMFITGIITFFLIFYQQKQQHF